MLSSHGCQSDSVNSSIVHGQETVMMIWKYVRVQRTTVNYMYTVTATQLKQTGA